MKFSTSQKFSKLLCYNELKKKSYPSEKVAQIFLDGFINDFVGDELIEYIEVRFWASMVFRDFVEVFDEGSCFFFLLFFNVERCKIEIIFKKIKKLKKFETFEKF